MCLIDVGSGLRISGAGKEQQGPLAHHGASIPQGTLHPAFAVEYTQPDETDADQAHRHRFRNRYHGGDELSLGDIPLGDWAYRWFSLPIERPILPKIENWYEQLKQRKPYQTHIMIPLS